MSEFVYSYYVERRNNVHSLNGYEYALQVIINGKQMVLSTYDAEPLETEISRDLMLFERSVDIYRWSLTGFFSFPVVKK